MRLSGDAQRDDVATTHTPGVLGGIAYVTTRYPSISHTFVLHEVNALRDRGIEVHTVSIRKADGEHLLSRGNRDAARSTFAIRPPRWRAVLRAHAYAASREPRAYLATLLCSLKMARPGWRGQLWQAFYFAEAIVLWRHCTTVRARHIHAHHASPPADVALLAAHFGRLSQVGPPTWSMTLHGPTELSNTRWFRLPEKVERADGVVCISDFARSQLMALVGTEHWPKLQVVRCGLTPEHYEDSPPLAATRRRIARPQILCVGRLVPEKGQAVLLRSHASLRCAGHDVDLVLVGSGPAREELERLTRQLETAEHVTFTGAVGQDQIRERYAAASVFCSSSFGEGVPVVLMEAMSCGCPVVATAIAGVRELVRDGETGLIVSPGCADQLTRAIAILLEDAGLRQRLAEAGRSYVAREFDVRRSARQLEGFFSRMLGVVEEQEDAAGSAAPRSGSDAVAVAR